MNSHVARVLIACMSLLSNAKEMLPSQLPVQHGQTYRLCCGMNSPERWLRKQGNIRSIFMAAIWISNSLDFTCFL